MILYLDTSALVKLYVAEIGDDLVASAMRDAESLVISVVGYAEARSAFVRKRNEGALSDAEYHRIVAGFDDDWPTFDHIEVLPDLYFRAGSLAEAHALRGFDALHLASALHAAETLDDRVSFLAFDTRLMNAARAERLTMFGEATPT